MRKTKILFVLVMLFYAFAAKAYYVEFENGHKTTALTLSELHDDEEDYADGYVGYIFPDFTVDGICYRKVSSSAVCVTFSRAILGHDTEDIGYYITDDYNYTKGGTYGTGMQKIPSTVQYQNKTWNVVGVEWGAFWRTSIPNYIYIPSSVTTFESGAFAPYPANSELKIFFESSTPPINALSSCVCTSGSTIYVPKGSKSAYQGWWYGTSYATIEEASFGICGPNAMWFTTDNLTLEIAGTGATNDYVSSPWSSISTLTTLRVGEGITGIGAKSFAGLTNLASLTLPITLTDIGENAFENCSSLTSITLPENLEQIGQQAFTLCWGLTEVTLGSKIEDIGNKAFYDCYRLERVTCFAVKVPSCFNAFTRWTGNSEGSYASQVDLYVPSPSVASYSEAYPWSDFKSVNPITDLVPVTIGSTGMGTFCWYRSIDFTGTDVKAYIVSAYIPSTGKVIMTRIYDVPAGTGIVVKGDPGEHGIPYGAGETVMANMLVGITQDTQLNKVDGDYTNYILAVKNDELGFYAVSNGTTLGAYKAYLPLPSDKLPTTPAAAARLMIEFDDETTGISEVNRNTDATGAIYNLSGQRMGQLRKGLNIVGGCKVFIK